jgi:hypothetical protein
VKRFVIALIFVLGSALAAHAQTATTASQVGPFISQSFAGGTASTSSWNFSITDLPANLLTSVPTTFTKVSTAVPTDAAVIATAQTVILAKITAANAAAPAQMVTVAAQRDVFVTVPTYSVMTIW